MTWWRSPSRWLIPILLVSAAHAQAGPRAVQARISSFRLEKPPHRTYYLDLTLHNFASEARWFLIPSALYSTSTAKANTGGIDRVEILQADGRGSVRIGKFAGTFRLQQESAGGFYALLLPPHAEIKLSDFPFGYWGEPPDEQKSLNAELVIARSFSVSGKAGADWFDGKPASDARAVVSLATPRALKTWRSPGWKEVKVSVVELERQKF